MPLRGGIGIALGAVVIWAYLTKCDYISTDAASTQSVYAPMLMLGVLTIVIAVVRIFSKRANMWEKFLGVCVVSGYLLSVVGSSTEFYLGMNNYFLLLPYLLWEIWLLCKEKVSGCMLLSAKIAFGIFVGFCLVLAVRFGMNYVYEEGSRSVRGHDYEVSENAVLSGMRLTARKAEILQGMTDFLLENGLSEREVILYDSAPSLAYYLQLTPAFNPWPSLNSYSTEKFEAALEAQKEKTTLPIVILTRGVESEEDGRHKSILLREYLAECGYEKVYEVGEFDVYVE